uniref:beta strand repeat-containing protein n=1 Tax=Bordetella genomosp. 13 TaxID=463040 RepID=UPI0016426CA5
VTTDAPGTLAIDGGLVDTTGIQSYGERAVLGADTQLTGATVTLSGGADSIAGANRTLLITGNAVLGSAVGANRALGALSVTGATRLAGNVTTTGAQSYTGNATLGNSVTLTTLDSDVTFSGAVGADRLARDLTVNAGLGDVSFAQDIGASTHGDDLGTVQVNSGGATTFGGSVYAASVATDAPGRLAIDGATIVTSGNQSYGERAVLGRDVTLKGATVTLSDGVDSGAATPAALLIAGNAVIDGDVGAVHELATLYITGTAALNGERIVTAGDQTYQGAVTLGNAVAINTTDGAVTFLDTVASKSGLQAGLAIDAGEGNVHFWKDAGDATTGRLGAVTVNSAGDTILQGKVYAASVTTDAPGTLAIDGGLVDTTGAQSYGERAVIGNNANLKGTLVTLGGGADARVPGSTTLLITGAADIRGAIGATGALGSLTITGDAALRGGSVRTSGAQAYQGLVTLDGAHVFSTTANGNVTFSGKVLGASAGAPNLTVNAGSGNVRFAQDIGDDGLQNVGAVAVNSGGATKFAGKVYAASVTTDAPGTLAIDGGLVKTSGAQSYGERAVLGADTALSGSAITLAQGVDGATAGGQALAVTATATQINGAVGANRALASLTITGNAQLGAGTIATTGAQSYDGIVTLTKALTVNSGNGAVTFGGALLSKLDAGHGLTVNAGSGNVRFADAVGFDDEDGTASRLGALAVNSSGATTFGKAVYAASVMTNAGGTLAIDGGLVDTTGTQSYGERAVLGGDTQLKGTTVTLAGADGNHALTIAGNGVINGAVGANTALASLSVTGTTRLAGNVTTVGTQQYAGNVTLGNTVALTTTNAAITFSTPVLSVANGGHGLSVTTGSGDVGFAGALGNSTTGRLGAVTVNSSGATTFGGGVYAASVTTDAPGTLAINGLRVDTTGAQSYGERAVLGGNTTLVGTLVSLAQGADAAAPGAAAPGAAALTITGNADIGGAVGATNALAFLTVSGTTRLADDVTTVGQQRYNGNVTLGDSVTLQTSDAAVGFGGTVASAADGGHALTVTAGGGDVMFEQAVGNATTGRLGALVINSGGATSLGGAVYAASVSTDAPGSLSISGGRVDTTGTQSYGELAYLGANTTLKGSSVTLAAGATGMTAGGQSLTVDGDAILGGRIGAPFQLASLNVTGTTALDTDTIATTGGQTYNGALTLGQDVVLTTDGGDVRFGGKVEGAHTLDIRAKTGDVAFDETIGASAAIGELYVDTTGATTFSKAVRAGSLTKTGAGSVAIDGGRIEAATQSYAGHVTLGQDTVLNGSEVSLMAGADGGHALDIQGSAYLGGAFGAAQKLASLNVSGATTLYEGSIATTGNQSYGGSVHLEGAQALTTQGGDVLIDGALSGHHDLSIATQDGDVTLAFGAGDTLTGLGDLVIDSAGATGIHGPVYADSVRTQGQGTVLLGGPVTTVGTQHYDSLVQVDGQTTLQGTQVALLGGADGAGAIDVVGDAVFAGAFGANQALAGLSVTGAATFNGGSIATTGDQSYGGAVTLAAAQALSSQTGNIGFDSTVDGTADFSVQAGGDIAFAGAVGAANRLGALVIDANGATRFDGAVRAASVITSEAGSLAINGGLVDTTGTQVWGERAVLGADTVLSGATVTLLSGVDATEAGQQGLRIAGNADIHGNVGAVAALRELIVDGATAMDAGSVSTTGNQAYAGAVSLSGARDLASGNGSVVLGSTLDGAGNSLSVSAGGDILVNGDAANLGVLTLRAVNTIVFNGDVSAYRVQQLEARSATYRGALTADDGIDLAGGSIAFGGDVQARNGAIDIASNDPAGTVGFSQNATVRAATGFTQTGGATLLLPAQLLVSQGPVRLGAVAYIQGASATIETRGDITATGIHGPLATLNLNPGLTGNLSIGLNDADPSHKLDVAVLSVPVAGSAQIYGTLATKTGAFAASLVTSPLVGSPFFLNGAVWGPTDTVNRVAAITAPRWIAPSKPSADSLFRGTVTPDAYGPDVLNAYADPKVLTVTFADTTTWQLPSGDANVLTIPSGDGSARQAPAGASQQPAIDGTQSSDDESKQNDAQRTL